MSEERRRRQQDRAGKERPKRDILRTTIIVMVIVAAFGATYYLGARQKASKYDAFAKCLTDKNIKMYGLYWCPHCEEQKEMFGPSFQYITYVECGVKGSRQEVPACAEAGVKNFPTWQFADGTRQEGTLQFPALSEKSGCKLP